MAGTTSTVDNGPPPEAVSGWSIFWALVAIVSHAMLQVSFTGYIWSGNSFQGSLWPHRSSPFICLVDGVADGYLCLRALLIRDPSDQRELLNSGRSGTLTRLALFTLGVLPQVIKLFAMRGIPVTQAIAAMYLLPSVLSLVRSLISKSPEGDIQKLLEGWAAGSSESKALPKLKIILTICGWVPHFIGTFVFYYGFVDRVGLSASDDLVNAVDWLTDILIFIVLLYVIQHMVFTLFKKRSPIPPSPTPLLLVFTHFCGVPDLLAVPGKRLKNGITKKWLVTSEQLLSLYLACYLCAGLLYYLVGWIYHRYNGSVSSESLATVNKTETPFSYEALPTQTRAQLLSWILDHDPPPNENVEPSQQPIAVPDQTMRNTDDNDVAGSTTGLGQSAIASTTSPVPEPAQNDDVRAITPSWRQRACGYLLYGFIIVWLVPMAVYYHVDSYVDPVKRDESDKVAKQQSAAEEGVVGTSATDSERDGQPQDTNSPSRSKSQELSRRGQSVIRAVDMVLRWILRSIWRPGLGFFNLSVYTFSWTWWQATKAYPTEILVNAFGLLNFSLAVLNYLVFFDGEGTSAPAWSDMFG